MGFRGACIDLPFSAENSSMRVKYIVRPLQESCGAEMSRYLRCLVAGLFTNVATRQPAAATAGGGRACYRTVVGNRQVNPPCACTHPLVEHLSRCVSLCSRGRSVLKALSEASSLLPFLRGGA